VYIAARCHSRFDRVRATIGRETVAMSKLLIVVAALGLAVVCSRCSSTTAAHEMTARCATGDREACVSADDAKEVRDEAEYAHEPEMGLMQSPPGLLPIPVQSRNLRSN